MEYSWDTDVIFMGHNGILMGCEWTIGWKPSGVIKDGWEIPEVK